MDNEDNDTGNEDDVEPELVKAVRENENEMIIWFRIYGVRGLGNILIPLYAAVMKLIHHSLV